ncbi:MAG: UDP-N-acetylmuramate--L-alanine ligase [Planctomycetota bacterium]
MRQNREPDGTFDNQHWHFVGILGTGMRALARYASERGVHITGSDVQESPALKDLTSRGINVELDQSEGHFDSATNRVVISQAIRDDNPELLKARDMGIEVVKYPELLGELMDLQPGIAVTGSHGKSTTSAMIAYVMQKAGRDPSYLIGADVPQLEGGSHCGRGDYLVAEACEYKRSFLYMAPHMGVVTNIDLEHTDYFRDMNDIRKAFSDFARQVDPDGRLILNADDDNSQKVRRAARCPLITYGIKDEQATYRAQRLWRAKVHSNFDLIYDGEEKGRFSIQLYGTHNVYNALACIAACHRAGLSLEEIREHLASFEGAARRLQLLGEPWDVAVLSDYAHHPKEIKASISATRQRFPNRRLFCIFQPHQYSRTRRMLPELAEAFDGAWEVFVADIYAARDSAKDRSSVSSADLVQAMNSEGINAHHVPDFHDIEDLIVGEVLFDDIVLVMGAGNIWQVARNIVPRIEQKGENQVAA